MRDPFILWSYVKFLFKMTLKVLEVHHDYVLL